jgi:hypothetical protein
MLHIRFFVVGPSYCVGERVAGKRLLTLRHFW